MRRLILVPIIHSEADLGSQAEAVQRQSAEAVGADRWARHQETVAAFWRAIEAHLDAMDIGGMKVFQDGLAADGELGRRIVATAADRGSVNHRLVLRLLERGAVLCASEDVGLLIQEHQHLTQLLTAGRATAQDLAQQRRLTEERDRFIADAINNGLADGETGVIFIGAYHDIAPHLAADIVVRPFREPALVRAYFAALVGGDSDDVRLRELAARLTSS